MVAVGVDGGRHHVAPHLPRERAHGDGGVERVVAHLVVHDVERAEMGKRVAHRRLVAPVDAHARDAVAERVGRVAARRDDHAMARAQQSLYEQPPDVTGTADHQNVLGHEVFLTHVEKPDGFRRAPWSVGMARSWSIRYIL